MPDTLHLTVTMPFSDYARGDRITDPDTVAALIKSHPSHVVVHAPLPDAVMEG